MFFVPWQVLFCFIVCLSHPALFLFCFFVSLFFCLFLTLFCLSTRDVVVVISDAGLYTTCSLTEAGRGATAPSSTTTPYPRSPPSQKTTRQAHTTAAMWCICDLSVHRTDRWRYTVAQPQPDHMPAPRTDHDLLPLARRELDLLLNAGHAGPCITCRSLRGSWHRGKEEKYW